MTNSSEIPGMCQSLMQGSRLQCHVLGNHPRIERHDCSDLSNVFEHSAQHFRTKSAFLRLLLLPIYAFFACLTLNEAADSVPTNDQQGKLSTFFVWWKNRLRVQFPLNCSFNSSTDVCPRYSPILRLPVSIFFSPQVWR